MGRRLPKAFEGDPASLQPDLVRKHLGRVLAHIRRHDRVFFNHLNDKAVLRYGEQNYYRPPKDVAWRVISE